MTRGAYPDATAKSGDWVCVDLKPVKPLASPVTLAEMKKIPDYESFQLLTAQPALGGGGQGGRV